MAQSWGAPGSSQACPTWQPLQHAQACITHCILPLIRVPSCKPGAAANGAAAQHADALLRMHDSNKRCVESAGGSSHAKVALSPYTALGVCPATCNTALAYRQTCSASTLASQAVVPMQCGTENRGMPLRTR